MLPTLAAADNGSVTEPPSDAPGDAGRAPGAPASPDPAAWASRLAVVLGLPALPPRTAGALLRISRDVAHATERLNAPLSTYVAGRHVARRIAEGGNEAAALQEVEAAVRQLLDEPPGS